MKFRCLAILLLAVACAAPARAASFCVSSVSGLANALAYYDLSASSDETVTIRIVQGTYAVGATLNRLYGGASANDDVNLKLLGGYTSNCASRQPDPRNTVLDGGNVANSGVGLKMHGTGSLLVEGITFTRFTGSTSMVGMGSASHVGEVLLIDKDFFSESDDSVYEVRQSRFIRNGGQAMIYMTGSLLRFVDNVVADNALSRLTGFDFSGAVVVTLDAEVDAAVTLTNNTVTGTMGGPGVLIQTLITGDSGRISEVTDNLLWNNAGPDIVFTGTAEHVYPLLSSFNLYGSANANYPQSSSDLHVDPRFVDAASGNYRLASNSPAINRGALLQLQGFPVRDADGAARITGSRIDIGAYESAIDDTTTAIVTTTGDNGSNTAPLAGSLRAAIKAANAASGPFTIRFDISGGCPRLLAFAGPMLDVTGDVTIDGTTQPGWTPNSQFGQFNGNLCLYVNGGDTPWAFHVPSTAPATARLVVRGLGFAGFNDAAIKLEGGRNHRIWGSQFGSIPLTVANRNAVRVTGSSGGAFIGGYDDEGAVNLFSGSTDAAIYLDNAAGGSTIANNVIGFQPDGAGNGGNASGVLAFNAKNNVLQYNRIGNSATNAIVLSGAGSSGNVVQYNTLGLDINGALAANGGAGVLINFAAKNNTIGAPVTATWGGNFIVGSTGPGVWISASGGSGNSVLDNSIRASGGLDIDLAQAGASANQTSNPASGPNGLQNYPVLTAARRNPAAGGTETVSGTLNSAPNTTYRIDLYYGVECSTPVPGRGLALYALMKSTVTTGAQGNVGFTLTVPFPLAAQLPFGSISATATDPSGNTSEIGNCVSEIDGDILFRNGFD